MLYISRQDAESAKEKQKRKALTVEDAEDAEENKSGKRTSKRERGRSRRPSTHDLTNSRLTDSPYELTTHSRYFANFGSVARNFVNR